MKGFSLFAAALALGLSLNITDAEAAKRLGGGTSSGMQRQTTTAPATTTPPTQMQSTAAPTASSAAKAPTAAAPAAQPKRSWMGPLAGLAAGLGLAALASHLGFGEELASMMMIGLLVMAVLLVVGFIMRRRAASQQQPAMAGAGAMNYSGSAPAQRGYDVSMPAAGAAATAPAAFEQAPAAAATIPAGFDVDGFVRQAKVNFIRLQASHDAGNLDDLREFTTPEMFAELKTNILGRSGAAQQTDVLEIDAHVLEVVEEASRYIVSVLYRGLLREDRDSAPEQINEIWHLVKPRDGSGGWRLAGIQQAQ